MATPTKPYLSCHPQFDPEAHAQWQALKEAEPYLEEHGLVFVRRGNARIAPEQPTDMADSRS